MLLLPGIFSQTAQEILFREKKNGASLIHFSVLLARAVTTMK